MDIIRKIYNGDYCPTDQEPPGSLEYQAVRAKLYKQYEQFRNELPMEQRPELDQLMDIQLEMALCEKESAYIEGARAGARILLDLLGGCL